MQHLNANVQVKNTTDKQIATVSVFHKYDKVKNRHTWIGPLKDNESTDTSMTVQYETGFGGTSKDWWYASWQYVGESKVYYTDPKNGQDFFSLFTDIVDDVNLAIETVALAEGDELAAIDIAKTASDMMINAIKNGDGGLKQCNLELDDANTVVIVSIDSENKVKFGIRSGSCSTGSSTHTSKALVAQ